MAERLILLPVFLLSAIGLHSLRQDQIQMEGDAKTQAAAIAQRALAASSRIASHLSDAPPVE